MNITVQKGKTLLVEGPASVAVLSGEAEVFGAPVVVSKNSKYPWMTVVRQGKRLPFVVQETADFRISLGGAAHIEEVEGSTIPQSWISAYDILREINKVPVVIFIVGRADTGKSSFCTYLANRIVGKNLSVAVLDEDIGQSDIGAPCTIAYAYVIKPVTDLFSLKPESAFFVGSTSPSGDVERTIEGTTFLREEILADKKAEFVIINTDGWVGDEKAVQFKSRLAEAVKPDVVFCLQGDELPTFCATLGDSLAGFRQERAESAAFIKERSSEKRRALRELTYSRYFENARVRVYALNHIKMEGDRVGDLIRLGRALNLLIGLYNGRGKFMGLGIIRDIDYERRAIKVFTSVRRKPATVFFGKVRIDENLHEIPQ